MLNKAFKKKKKSCPLLNLLWYSLITEFKGCRIREKIKMGKDHFV